MRTDTQTQTDTHTHTQNTNVQRERKLPSKKIFPFYFQEGRLQTRKIINTKFYSPCTSQLQILVSIKVKVKVKCTLVQALRLCTGLTAYRGSRSIALPLHDHGTRRGWGVSVTSRPLFTPGKDSVPIVQEAWCIPGPVWIGAENLAPTGIRFPDRPARSQSLYRLRYSVHYVSVQLP